MTISLTKKEAELLFIIFDSWRSSSSMLDHEDGGSSGFEDCIEVQEAIEEKIMKASKRYDFEKKKRKLQRKLHKRMKKINWEEK